MYQKYKLKYIQHIFTCNQLKQTNKQKKDYNTLALMQRVICKLTSN